MQNRIWIALSALMLFTGASAFCQDVPAEDAISAEEYAIYRLALGNPVGWSAVAKETLAGVRADADGLIPPAGIRPDPDMLKAFNAINSRQYPLSADFLGETAQDAGDGFEGRRKTTFSRVGFDPQRRQALLIVGTTWYTPEDIMNEGHYIFLENIDGKWTVAGSARAWDMRLGPIP
jgi:hypothetical protein